MTPLIDPHRSELEQLCRRFHVKRLELFGSAATAEFDPQKSDVDFLVEFQEMSPSRHADAYFGLLAALQDLFGRGIDLIEIKAIRNPYFLASLRRDRTLLYAA